MRERIMAAVGPVVFLLAGAACLLAYVLPGQQAGSGDREARQAQAVLRTQVPPAQPVVGGGAALIPAASAAAHGRALAAMRIPRFGADWRWVALEGTSDEVIADGPGHYEGTALPGGRGNSAWAAHRAGHGDPFIDFDRLRPGDLVTFQQGAVTWTYRITMRPRIIDTDDVWVLDPLPGRRLTLTTCWPKYGSERRMYVRGRLVPSAGAGPVAQPPANGGRNSTDSPGSTSTVSGS